MVKLKKPIKLIELFAGYGSQAMALRNIGAKFEHHLISEWETNVTKSYRQVHYPDIPENTDYSKRFNFEQLVERLTKLGISTDGKNPMTEDKIRRKGETWCRDTFNDFVITKNVGSISNIKGSDLMINDTDNYDYILVYTYPCQDLSIAGKGKGMAKGSGTRSGLLWEVERLLTETPNLPQVLLMENVPQVHSKKNLPDFEKWIEFLESMGYKNFYQDLNAKDYGVAQNRNRTFMFSFLQSEFGDDIQYTFPKPIPLDKVMKDYLEDEVDEKYFINTQKAKELIDKLIVNGDLP